MHHDIDKIIIKTFYFMQSCYLGHGWGYLSRNSQVFIEPTCWGINFLTFSNLGHDMLLSTLNWLDNAHNADGGWPNFQNGPSDIRTANVLYTLNFVTSEHQIRNKKTDAVSWLVQNQKKMGGWSWNKNSWNFAEPTCLAALALLTTLDSHTYENPTSKFLHTLSADLPTKESLFASTYKSDLEAIRAFILGLQCTDGGWNSHSPKSLGYPQIGMSSISPWVLMTLKCMGEDMTSETIQQLLKYIYTHEQDYWDSPYSLGCILMSLASTNSMREFQEKLVDRLLDLQGENGSWMNNTWWTAIIGLALVIFWQTI